MRKLTIGLLIAAAAVFALIGCSMMLESARVPAKHIIVTEYVPAPTTTTKPYAPPPTPEMPLPTTESGPIPDVVPNIDGPNVSCRKIFKCGVNW